MRICCPVILFSISIYRVVSIDDLCPPVPNGTFASLMIVLARMGWCRLQTCFYFGFTSFARRRLVFNVFVSG